VFIPDLRLFGFEVSPGDAVAGFEINSAGDAEVPEIREKIDHSFVGYGGMVAARRHGGAQSGPCGCYALRVRQ
jgi:hypothetical protein